jgi:hypothetical protein
VPPAPDRVAAPLLVDGHVHLHPCFDPVAFLDAAAANFRAAAARLGFLPETPGCLLLTDADDSDSLSVLRGIDGGGWRPERTLEDDSLLLRSAGRLRLLALAGRQIATWDGLELLALLGDPGISSAPTLQDAISAARSAGAVPVIPWGFGKWTLRRARSVRQAWSGQPGLVFLGDNGGRLTLGRLPTQLREARRVGVPVLPGSDPLPFPDHEDRAGSYGFVADVDLPLDAPAACLREYLLGLQVQPPVFGMRRPLAWFAYDQVRMQLWKRRRRPGS